MAKTSEPPQEQAVPRSDGSDAPTQVRLGLSSGVVVAMANLAMVQLVVMLARYGVPQSGGTTRLVHLGNDVLGYAGAAALAATALHLWRSRGPKRAGWGLLALTLFSVGLGLLILDDDIYGFIDRKLPQLGSLGLWGGTVAVALGVPAAAWVGGIVAKTRLWPAVVVAAIAGMVANPFVLAADYRAAHLYLAWACVTLLTVSFAERPWRSPVPARLHRRIGVAAGLGGLLAFAVPPGNALVLDFAAAEGSLLGPFAAQAWGEFNRSQRPTVDVKDEWFQERPPGLSVPPSTPPIVEDDPIVLLLTIDSLRADLDRLSSLLGCVSSSFSFSHSLFLQYRFRSGGVHEIGGGQNIDDGRLRFSTDNAEAARHAEVIFLAVGTPTGGDDGAPDLSALFGAAAQVGAHLDDYTVIVNKSTVPVGTAERVRAAIAEQTSVEFDVVSNPEFLKEGTAVKDFMSPDRVIIGVESERA